MGERVRGCGDLEGGHGWVRWRIVKRGAQDQGEDGEGRFRWGMNGLLELCCCLWFEMVGYGDLEENFEKDRLYSTKTCNNFSIRCLEVLLLFIKYDVLHLEISLNYIHIRFTHIYIFSFNLLCLKFKIILFIYACFFYLINILRIKLL